MNPCMRMTKNCDLIIGDTLEVPLKLPGDECLLFKFKKNLIQFRVLLIFAGGLSYGKAGGAARS